MAPLSKAVQVQLAYIRHDHTRVYKGSVDAAWTIGAVPHGGYVASLLISACLEHQSPTAPVIHPHPRPSPHPDPAHLTAQFLSPSTVGPFEIHVRTFSTSKRWTRLDVEMFQPGKDLAKPLLRVRAHVLFTTLDEPKEPRVPERGAMTVLPSTPSQFARICPLKKHPAECEESDMLPVFNFREHVKWSEGTDVLGSRGKDEDGQVKMEWGAWFELADEEEDVRKSAAIIPFFSDMFRNGPELLPPEQGPGSSWYPTISFSLDILSKFPLHPLPSLSTPVARRTIGLYSVTKFVASGRHDNVVEVWSAPSGIGEDVKVGTDEWRRHAQILAVSSQMALVIPFAVNARNGKL